MKSRAAVVAVVAFVLVAIAGAADIVKMTGRSIDETVAVQAAEAPEIARLYIAKYGSLAAAAPTIVRLVSRSGVHVIIVDRKTGTIFSSGGGHALRWLHRSGEAIARDAFPPPPGSPPFSSPPGQPHDHLGPPLGDAFGRGDWFAMLVASAAGESARRTPIPDGEIAVFPDPRSILRVFELVAAGLGLVFAASGFALWMYVRGVRRAALRPLHETTLALRRLAQRDFSPRTIMAGEGSAYDELARAYNAAVEAVSSAFAERRAAESEMQRFIADAGHELRTPLTIVMGYLDIIAAGALNEPAVANRISNGMRTEATRMRKLIDKLIILAKMETPSDLDARSNVDVVSLVQRVIESLEPLTAQPMNVTGVPFAHVFANEDDVAEALTNIIENGLKYAPASPIDARIERCAGSVVIAISDQGPGMSTDEQRNAFERFYRGEKRGEISGSGLGLAIAKRAIERARGTIRLDTAVGAGTTFTIELPEQSIAVSDGPPARFAHR